MTSSHPIELQQSSVFQAKRLSEFLSEVDEVAGSEDVEIFSVSKVYGFVPQNERFSRRIASKDTKRYKLVWPGDFVFDPMLLWDGSIVYNDTDKLGAVSPAYSVLRPRPGTSAAYLRQLLIRKSIISRYREISVGTNVRRKKAHVDDFLALEFRVPDLPEQRAIARVLGDLDQQLACIRRSIESLDRAHRTSVLTLVQGARVAALGDIAKIRNGVTPSRARVDYWDCGTIPWVTSGKVSEGSIESADQFVTTVAVEDCRMRVFAPGTLLVGLIGQGKTRGTVASLRIHATINQNVAAVAVEAGTSPGFVGAYLRCAYEKLRTWSHGTGPDALSCATLAAFPIPIPHPATQENIAQFSECIQNCMNTSTAHLTALRTFRRHLADALLSGRLRIPAHLWPTGPDGAADAT